MFAVFLCSAWCECALLLCLILALSTFFRQIFSDVNRAKMLAPFLFPSFWASSPPGQHAACHPLQLHLPGYCALPGLVKLRGSCLVWGTFLNTSFKSAAFGGVLKSAYGGRLPHPRCGKLLHLHNSAAVAFLQHLILCWQLSCLSCVCFRAPCSSCSPP